jgi:hypothetical protein
MNGMAPRITARMARTFSPTTTSFTWADSLVPRRISQVVNRVMPTAGRSNHLPLEYTWPSAATASGAPVSTAGKCKPNDAAVLVK